MGFYTVIYIFVVMWTTNIFFSSHSLFFRVNVQQSPSESDVNCGVVIRR